MRLYGKAVLLILTLPLVLAGDDFFQVKERIVKGSDFRLLGLYIRPDFSLRNTGYTTNIFTYSDYETPDWVAEPGLDLSVSAVLRDRLIISGFAQPYYSLYLNHPHLNDWSGRWGAEFFTHVGRLNLKATVFRTSQLAPPSAEFAVPYRNHDSSVGLVVDWGRADSFFVSLSGERRDLEMKGGLYLDEYDPARLLDRREETYGASLNRMIFSATLLSLGFQFQRFRFASAGGRDADSRKYIVGLSFPETGNLTGSFAVGLREFLPRKADFPRASNAIGEGEVKLKLFDRLKLSGEMQIDRFYSLFGDLLYFRSRSLGGGGEFYLSGWLKTGYFVRESRLNYSTLDSNAQVRRDRFRQQTVSLGVRVGGRWTLGLAYTLYEGSSSDSRFNRNFAFVGGTISNEF